MPAPRPTLPDRTPAPRRRTTSLAIAVAMIATLAAVAPARLAAADQAAVTVKAAPFKVAAGSEGTLKITLTITEGYQLVAAPPPNEHMTPVMLILSATEGLAPLGPVYPEPKQIHEEGFAYPAYEGKVTITLPVRAAKDAAPGRRILKGTLRHQPIRSGLFMKMKVLPVEIAVEVTAAKKGGKPAEPATRP